MTDWSFAYPVKLDDQRLLIRVQVSDLAGDESREVCFDFSGREFDDEGFITSWGDGAFVRQNAVWFFFKGACFSVDDFH